LREKRQRVLAGDAVAMADERITPGALERLSGAERLGPATVLEFWRWALGDLRAGRVLFPRKSGSG
jgi:hypothetical protein